MAKTPVPYSQEIADAICERLAGGETLKSICRDEGMPNDRAVRSWALEDVQSSRYDASLRRWEGETGVTQGGYVRSAMNSRADSTLTSGIIKGGIQLGSIASKYGGPSPAVASGGVDDSGWGMTDWSKYT